ncbi:PepSY-associated TM helix domain-containing protein [Leptolyngbya sp. NIES-2104]|uniref:PepSY-associated TM helix domain-containing protein n=1 Tax=Leptolyngbya sp. NIES-2104 TaxID=1552121 RepID=UPI0006ECCE2A|nr:PepSY-associated TM helix domain-containing protein [Leptolyngbya sp. NIES-2104]GAP93906.1 uncharacterized iron-regulated membrane protein [Leptolyngbya sp. NIES-2104]
MKSFRNTIFTVHRYLGLFVGLILVVVGLTGSLLVFEHETDDWIIQQRFGRVIHQEQRLSIGAIVETVQATYADHPDWKIAQVQMLPSQEFYTVRLNRPDQTQWEVFVNPYIGSVIGDRQRETALFNRALTLHYQLFAGEIGMKIVGVAALMLCVLSLTGIALWSGWRKFFLGFEIKWNAHPKRVHYDIHKVAGIVTAGFLSAIALTGFCWNFYEQTEPLIYAATFTPKPPEVQSTVTKSKPLSLDEIIRRSNTALPGAVNTFVILPSSPDGVFHIFKKLPEDREDFISSVKLDQYSGKVLQVKDSRTANLGDRVLNAFTPIHYGTFGGLPTRIFYVFVGFAPTILMITGFVMWWYRKRRKATLSPTIVNR